MFVRLNKTAALLLIALASATARASDATFDASLAYWTAKRDLLSLTLQTMKHRGLDKRRPADAGELSRELAGAEATLGNDNAALAALEQARSYTPEEPWIQMRAYQVHMLAGRVSRADAALQELDMRLRTALQYLPDVGQGNGSKLALKWADYRTAWANGLVYTALARGASAEAVRLAEQRCDYGRLYIMVTNSDKDMPGPTVKRLQQNEQLLQQGRPLESDLAATSCSADGMHPSIMALVARARAGLAVRGPDIEARYGAVSQEPASRHEHLGSALLELVLHDTPVSDETLKDMEAEPQLEERLDALCEAYYFQGMYYRYIARDEQRATFWLERAATSASFGTYERILARAELGWPATGPLTPSADEKIIGPQTDPRP